MSLSREPMLMDPEDHVGVRFDEDQLPIVISLVGIAVIIGMLIVVLTTPLSSN